MPKFMKDFKSKDLVALIAIIAVLVYKALGHNGGFDALITLIIGYYFGRRDDPTLQLPGAMVEEQVHDVSLKQNK